MEVDDGSVNEELLDIYKDFLEDYADDELDSNSAVNQQDIYTPLETNQSEIEFYSVLLFIFLETRW